MSSPEGSEREPILSPEKAARVAAAAFVRNRKLAELVIVHSNERDGFDPEGAAKSVDAAIAAVYEYFELDPPTPEDRVWEPLGWVAAKGAEDSLVTAPGPTGHLGRLSLAVTTKMGFTQDDQFAGLKIIDSVLVRGGERTRLLYLNRMGVPQKAEVVFLEDPGETVYQQAA